MLAALSSQWKAQDSPLYGRLATSSEGRNMERLITPLLKEMERAPERVTERQAENIRLFRFLYEHSETCG